jgi:hypothetical protein
MCARVYVCVHVFMCVHVYVCVCACVSGCMCVRAHVNRVRFSDGKVDEIHYTVLSNNCANGMSSEGVCAYTGEFKGYPLWR